MKKYCNDWKITNEEAMAMADYYFNKYIMIPDKIKRELRKITHKRSAAFFDKLKAKLEDVKRDENIEKMKRHDRIN